MSRGHRKSASSCSSIPFHGEPHEVKRRVEGVISYPAVGMLIFASCLVVASQAGSPSFNSPRPCPQSRLGSRPASRRPITTSRVGHRTQSLHFMSALNVLLTGSLVPGVSGGLGRTYHHGQGDKALQECNLSTWPSLDCVRASGPERSNCRPGFSFGCLCNPRPKAKNSSILSSNASWFIRMPVL